MAGTPGWKSSTEEWVLVGRIAGARGIRGELRLAYFSDDAETLRGVTHLRLAPEGRVARRLRVTSLQPGRRGELRLTLEGVDSRDAAEAWTGCEVFAPAAELAALAEGEHYGHEILGCEVFDTEGARLGVVEGIWETGAPDVLVVTGEGGAEHLVPAALVVEVDVTARRITAEIPPGLLDGEDA